MIRSDVKIRQKTTSKVGDLSGAGVVQKLLERETTQRPKMSIFLGFHLDPRPFPHINRRLGATPLITLVSFLSAAGSCFFSQVPRYSREQRPTIECNNKVILFIFSHSAGAGVGRRRSASPNLFPSSDYANGISRAAAAHLRHLMKPRRCASASPADAIDRKTHPRTGPMIGFRTPLLSRQPENFDSNRSAADLSRLLSR